MECAIKIKMKICNCLHVLGESLMSQKHLGLSLIWGLSNLWVGHVSVTFHISFTHDLQIIHVAVEVLVFLNVVYVNII